MTTWICDGTVDGVPDSAPCACITTRQARRMHGAGWNVTTDVRRMANLLQVSSAFGRDMEVVDRDRMVRAVYPRAACAPRTGHDVRGGRHTADA